MITISYPSGSISGDTVFDIEERIARLSDDEQDSHVWQWDEARKVWQRFDGATTDLYGPDEYPLRIKDLTRFLAYVLDDDTINVRDIKVEVSLEDDERPFPWEVLAYRESIGLGARSSLTHSEHAARSSWKRGKLGRLSPARGWVTVLKNSPVSMRRLRVTYRPLSTRPRVIPSPSYVPSLITSRRIARGARMSG